MVNLRPDDIYHKHQLNRLLIEIVDDPLLSQNLAFKGGTAAEMLGFLDRFSVDLDFDLLDKSKHSQIRKQFHNIFSRLELAISKEFEGLLFFQVKYVSKNERQRNTIKISAQDTPIAANEYRVQFLKEIDRLVKCQTIETMFANKLVALTDRYNKHETVAGRDIYDIHHYFTNGYLYRGAVIEERTGLSLREYLVKLLEFIDKHVTQTIINEDLYALLPGANFQQIRKILIPETRHILEQESKSLSRLC